jgi:hypothetical protein
VPTAEQDAFSTALLSAGERREAARLLGRLAEAVEGLR